MGYMSHRVPIVPMVAEPMTTRRWILVLLLIFALPALSRADESWKPLQSIIANHCAKCHGQKPEPQGDVDLASLSTTEDLLKQPELLESMIAVLNDRIMPPEDEQPLPESLRTQTVGHLQSMLATAVKSQPFGHTPIRRMNRFQYNNAVVDLLELDRDIFQLNERLMRRRQNYFRPDSHTMPKQVKVSSRPMSKDIDNQRPEGFRGVSAFPQDKRAEHGFDNRADHLSLSPLLMESFLQLSQSIVESPDLNPQECRSWDRLFAAPGESARGPIDGRYEAEVGSFLKVDATTAGPAAPQNMKNFAGQWSRDAQLFWRCQKAGHELTLSFNVQRAGHRLSFGLTKAGDYGTFDIFLDDTKIADAVDLYHTNVVDGTIQIPDAGVDRGRHTLRFTCTGKNAQSTGHFFGLDYVDVAERQADATSDGPAVSETEAVRLRLTSLLRRAFRRPVSSETLNHFCRFASDQLAAGVSFEDTMRTLVGAILSMPGFLYTYESRAVDADEPLTAGNQPLDDFELASRLAWFLWSSIPDDSLLDLAESGQLHQPSVLAEQIDRMLNDQRVSRFCDNFPTQWLQLDRLITAIPTQRSLDTSTTTATGPVCI